MTKYKCALCGKVGVAESMVFSRETRNRYCIDTIACDRRRKRKEKK